MEISAIRDALRKIPRTNPDKAQQYWYPLARPTYGAEEVAEALDSMMSFRTTCWAKVAQFEQAFAKWLGCADAVMVNSGSSADLLLVQGPPRRLTISALTWPTQVWSALQAGHTVDLVDINPDTLLPDTADYLNRPGTPFVVHVMGNVSDMDTLRADRPCLEDGCEALGAEWNGQRVGAAGDAAFSFFFSHHIMTMEGGMIACSQERGEELRTLRNHGWDRHAPAPYTFTHQGYNLRPTEVQAAFGLHQLRRLDGFLDARARLARRFFYHLRLHPWLRLPRASGTPAWFGLPMLVRPGAPYSRDALCARLEALGVETRPILAGNVARQPAGKQFAGHYPGADLVHDTGFYVGLSPASTVGEIDRLAEILCGL